MPHEWGWDEPDTKFMRQNIQKMEQMPFDGVIFHVVSSKGGNLTWEMWGNRRFELAEFQHAIDDLKATPFHRFTDRFLRVNVTPGNVDWFDDQAWAVVVQNFTVAAQIAKQGGCKGFMFDVEQYNDQLFHYEKQKHRTSKSFAEYQAKVRQRGQEWMKAVNGQYPDITILLTFGYSITGGQPKDRAGAAYGLLADFLDGMLDACSPQTRIVDAWEGAYTYKQKDQFQKAYETIKVKSGGMDCRARKVPPPGPGRVRHLDGLQLAKGGLAPGRFVEEPLHARRVRGDGSFGIGDQRPIRLDLHRTAPLVDEREAAQGIR